MSKVSVIVPCYNYGKFIPETLESVFEQTYENWECIVVDDGSTDNTNDVISAFINKDRRFRYIYQGNKGLSSARNTGIKEAKGEFVQFLDADDLIERRKFECQVKYFIEHPEVDIVYGDVRYFFTDKPHERLFSVDGRKISWMPKISGRGKYIVKQLIEDNIMVVSSPLVRRNVINICGLFNEDLKASEDWEYWIRCALYDFNFTYFESPETFTLIRYHSSNMSKDRFVMLDAKLQMHYNLDVLLTDNDLKTANAKEIGRVDFLRALETIRSGHKLAGLHDLLKLSLKNYCFNYLPYGLKLFVFGK